MMRALTRSISSDYFSNTLALFKYSAQDIIMSPPEYAKLPKVGLFNGGYEVFHDFAIVLAN